MESLKNANATVANKLYIIPGPPIAWARPGQGKWGRYDTQSGDKMVVATNLRFLHNGEIYKKPLALTITFFVKHATKRPGSYNSSRPDLDNMIKFYLDAMTGIIYEDDKQIVRITASKIYDREPRTEFYIEEL